MRFNPPPHFPVTVVADATAVPEVIQLVCNQPPMVFGGDCIHDYRAEHPDNKVFMVVDSALSRTQLTKDEDELFYEHLSAIGRIVVRRYKTEQILVTSLVP